MKDKIILIGNGFDLAHGLPTSYSDFLVWYANQAINEFNEGWLKNFDNKNIFIRTQGHQLPRISNLQQFVNIEGISIYNKLLRSILSYSSINNWVDIEYVYYSELTKIYKQFEKLNVERNGSLESDIQKLNDDLEHLKSKLIEYLNQLDLSILKVKSPILEKLQTKRSNESGKKTIFLIFNYTKTFDLLYKEHVVRNNDVVIYIHGELNSKTNPIIFGYGDETDIYYEKIERLNINEFTKNFKSFKYSHTNNYKNLFGFAYTSYDVTIIGHSCGISDRVLLKEIFTRKNCQSINIYHYKRPNGTTDFEEKIQEISRHFPADMKHQMRTMIFDLGPLMG